MAILFGVTNKGIKRFAKILRVLTKHGFGFLLQRMPLRQWMPFIGKMKKEARLDESQPQSQIARRMVMALEELGPTYVKFGQILSNRPDLLPPEYIEELKKLQDRVAPFESEKAIRIIESEFARPLTETFKNFETPPFASGSIAQVHYAKTLDGTEVVVKIKRPGIDAVISSDLIILYRLADLFERYVPEIAALNPKMLISEFERAIREELDLLAEASHTAKFSRNFEGDRILRIPRVFWEYTTRRVLTLEKISGIKVSDAEALRSMGIDPRKLARDLLRIFLDQYYKSGFFHADPHPGNILAAPDGTIGLIDFGTVGHLDYDLKSSLAATLLAVINEDVEAVLEIYEELGVVTRYADAQELKPEIMGLIDKYYGMPVENIDLKQLFNEFIGISRRHNIMLRRDFVLLGKSFVSIASTARNLDPKLDSAEIIEPYARNLIRQKYSPRHIQRLLQSSFANVAGFIKKGPRNLSLLLSKIINNEVEIAFRHENLDKLITEMDRSSNRLSFSILIAAIILGSSLIILAKVKPFIFGDISLLGVIGYLLAGILGMGLAVAILRSGRL